MKTQFLALLGCASVAALSGCATSMPVRPSDRALLPSVSEVFPATAKQSLPEKIQKRHFPDGTVELSYTLRTRHDGLPILLYSSIGDFPTALDATEARNEADRSHNRLLMSLEQREADSFIPGGPDASTQLFFAGMQPVGLHFSTTLGTKAYTFLCLAPPRYFNAHRTAEMVKDRLELLERTPLAHSKAKR